MEKIAFLINAVTGIQGSSTGGSSSMRLEGIIAMLASLVVWIAASRFHVTLAPEEVVGQLTALASAGATVWYACGAIRASLLWFKQALVK